MLWGNPARWRVSRNDILMGIPQFGVFLGNSFSTSNYVKQSYTEFKRTLRNSTVKIQPIFHFKLILKQVYIRSIIY